MSLTGELHLKTTPLRIWFDRTFPTFKAVQPSARWTGPLGVAPLASVPWRGRVGTAFDYRVRWWWPWTPSVRLIGMEAVAPIFLGENSTDSLRRYLDTTIASLAATTSRGEPSDDVEDHLARAALVLAQLETVQRSHLPPDPASTGIAKGASVEAMLATQDARAVDDVIALSRAARDPLARFVNRSAVLNPTFSWSNRVGGADADLIVDGCLLELKTSCDTGLTGEVARQLLGYILLDGDDRYQIRDLAVFYARRPQVLRWPVAEFVDACSARSVGVAVLRAEVNALLPTVGPIEACQPDPNQLDLFG